MNTPKHITVIGAGYVGLVSSACFAEFGFSVICVDKNPDIIERLQNGKATIHEPALNRLIQKNSNKHLSFSHSIEEAILSSNIIFITIGTPLREDQELDISQLESTVKQIAPLLNTYKVIVIKSTTGVGTARHLGELIYAENSNAQFDIVSNPEFLRAGSAINDFLKPERVIIGVESKKAHEIISEVYQTFVNTQVPIIYTTLENSELIKQASNCFLAAKIGFANEIAYLCEQMGTNTKVVLQGIGLDKRIGSDYLQPGPGFGGSCLSKDALALCHRAKQVNASLSITESALNSNTRHKQRMLEKILKACLGSVKNKRLAILGISFKANTDDTRESSALFIIDQLIKQGSILKLYDPVVKHIPQYNGLKIGITLEETIKDTDAIIIMTEWNEFRDLDLKKLKGCLRNEAMPPTLIDLRNLYVAKQVEEAGIAYFFIGRTGASTNENIGCHSLSLTH